MQGELKHSQLLHAKETGISSGLKSCLAHVPTEIDKLLTTELG